MFVVVDLSCALIQVLKSEVEDDETLDAAATVCGRLIAANGG